MSAFDEAIADYRESRDRQSRSFDDSTTFDVPATKNVETGKNVGNAARSHFLRASQFVWRDPMTIPPRPWVYGQHMIRKQVSVTIAPVGVGKSSLTLVEGLAMVTGRELLGEWVSPKPMRVWIYNLEDPRDEMECRVIAAMMHQNVKPDDLGGRLFIDTGRERPLCTALEVQGNVTIARPELDALAAEITARGIDVLIIDPFVSSHRVNENASGAIDLVAKEWARLVVVLRNCRPWWRRIFTGRVEPRSTIWRTRLLGGLGAPVTFGFKSFPRHPPLHCFQGFFREPSGPSTRTGKVDPRF